MIELDEVYQAMGLIEDLEKDGPNHDSEEWPRGSCGEPFTAMWKKTRSGMVVKSISCGECRYRIIADREEETDA